MEDSTKKKIIILVMILSGIVAFISLITTATAYFAFQSRAGDFNRIADSWKNYPIIDIRSARSACPSAQGWEKIEQEWEGTHPACDCSTKRPGTNSTTSSTSSCSSKQSGDGCSDRPGIPAVDLSPFILGDSANPRVLCVQRGFGKFYPNALARTQIRHENEDGDVITKCHAAEQVCGAAKSTICWPANKPCPITDVRLLTGVIDPNATAGWTRADTFVGRDNVQFSIMVSRGKGAQQANANTYVGAGGSFGMNGLPLLFVDFTENHVCQLDPEDNCGYGGSEAIPWSTYETIVQNKKQFGWVLKQKCTGCKEPDAPEDGEAAPASPKGYDLRYDSFYSVDIVSTYVSAGVPSDYFPPQGKLLKLEFSPEVEWLPTCGEDKKTVNGNTDEVDSVVSAQLVLFIFAVISFIVLALVFPCLKVKKDEEWQEQNKLKMNCAKWGIKIAMYTCIIISAVIAYKTIGFWLAVSTGNEGETVCTDALSYETIDFLSAKFNELSKKNVVTFATNGVAALGDLFEVIVSNIL